MAETPLSARLRYIRGLQEAEQARLAEEKTCPHDGDTAEFLHTAGDGSRQLYRGCVKCKHKIDGRALPHNGQSIDDVPIGRDDRWVNPPCARCGAFGTQLHHFAPQAIFGKAEANLWPTAWLCTDCHELWHRMMKEAT